MGGIERKKIKLTVGRRDVICDIEKLTRSLSSMTPPVNMQRIDDKSVALSNMHLVKIK